jgi:hypothetical protein
MARTIKERNTQRRKRRRGVEKKTYEIGKLCGFDVALIMYNPDEDQYYMYLSTRRESWPPSKEQIVSRPSRVACNMIFNIRKQFAHSKFEIKYPEDVERIKSRKGQERIRKRVAREVSISKGVTSNDNKPEKLMAAATFLPEPPSFDLTLFKKKIGKLF